MSIILLLTLFSAAVGQPGGQDMTTYSDGLFVKYDHNPKDGFVMESEWLELLSIDDTNHDMCVTLQEYLDAHVGMPAMISDGLYSIYDHDNNGCLNGTDMSTEYHLFDLNGDNQVSLHEWEQYFNRLFENLFGHGPDVGKR